MRCYLIFFGRSWPLAFLWKCSVLYKISAIVFDLNDFRSSIHVPLSSHLSSFLNLSGNLFSTLHSRSYFGFFFFASWLLPCGFTSGQQSLIMGLPFCLHLFLFAPSARASEREEEDGGWFERSPLALFSFRLLCASLYGSETHKKKNLLYLKQLSTNGSTNRWAQQRIFSTWDFLSRLTFSHILLTSLPYPRFYQERNQRVFLLTAVNGSSRLPLNQCLKSF